MQRYGLILSMLLLFVSAVAGAQESTEPKVSLDAKEMPLAEAITSISKQSGIVILTSNLPDRKLSASLDGVTLETALKVICVANKLTWRKIWAAPNAKGEYDSHRLVRALRALDDLGSAGLMVRDPETGATSLALRAISPNVKVEPTTLPGSPALKEIYFVYGSETTGTMVATKERESSKPSKTKKSASDPVASQTGNAANSNGAGMNPGDMAATAKVGSYAQNQAQAMTDLSTMNSGERKAAIKNNLQLFNQLDPNTKKDMAHMGLQMYLSMDPTTRRQLAGRVRREMQLPDKPKIPGNNPRQDGSRGGGRRNRQPGAPGM